MAKAEQSGSSGFTAFGWAAYLGASWTWCIGMYLPILMVRDLGLAGYLVFAIPNVLGAAAMGWVLRSPESSLRLTTTHRAACRAFSYITNAYHAYWAAWLAFFAARTISIPGWVWVLPLGLLLLWLVVLGMQHRDNTARLAGLATMTVSLVALMVWLLRPEDAAPRIESVLKAVPSSSDAMWMLPMSVLGFALCPYLDLTFHRARQASMTRRSSRVAFGVGFCVCFALMIVFTLLYAGPLVQMVDGDPSTLPSIAPLLAAALGVHVGIQLVFTTAAHRREVQNAGGGAGHALLLTFAAALGVAAAGFAEFRIFDMAYGELGYRVFLSFYGLIFPAYVWLNVLDLRMRTLRGPTAGSLKATALAIALAAPFYFVGFMLRIEPWLIPGVAIILLAKLFAGQSPADDRLRSRTQAT